ncbi:hypothetical protein MHYP_G00288920 [Metynnis hypsauchen]
MSNTTRDVISGVVFASISQGKHQGGETGLNGGFRLKRGLFVPQSSQWKNPETRTYHRPNGTQQLGVL